VSKVPFTEPAPPRWAAAKIPDSVTKIPLTNSTVVFLDNVLQNPFVFDKRATMLFLASLGLLKNKELSYIPTDF
jgi:hypothetical protein